LLLGLAAAACVRPVPVNAQAQWKPAQGPLVTRWTKDVTPDGAGFPYPRPQMARDRWSSLNGLWDYAIRPKDAEQPRQWDGKILVPFPVESALSGVKKPVGPNEFLWYRLQTKAAGWKKSGGRVLLHFGAVDWESTVWVDGQKVGDHRGGYDPFTFDITDALGDGEQHEVIVRVADPTTAGYQPIGKQHLNPHGIWYTPTTGIWQTVWVETVPELYIRRLKLVPDVDAGQLRVGVETNRPAAGVKAVAIVNGDGKEFVGEGPVQGEIVVTMPGARLWSPGDPFLYDLEVSISQAGGGADAVTSYCAMRKISLGKDDQGAVRLFLNNKPLFQFGPLDQGFWPDGLYTAPNDEALRYDIELTKKLGFNMIRKHVKVEPDRWYYWCDKLGLLVWQDMPSGDRHVAPGRGEIERSAESAENFRREWRAMIEALYNHPCIVMWVPFNEGWGQFDTKAIVDLTRQLDPTRLVNGASGWNDVPGVGDVHDIHVYPGPGAPPREEHRAAVLGEFGGLGLPLKGHLWQEQRNWGYRTFTSQAELQRAYERLIRQLRPLIGDGLAAAVYTQTTDVEIEVNGLMTYDRAVVKFDADRLAALHRTLYEPPRRLATKTLVPTSEHAAQTWRHTTTPPSADWFKAEFDDSKWQQGEGGFGTQGTPGAVVRTQWNTSEIWLRRTFELASTDVRELHLRLHHDEDAEIYLNGQPIETVQGYTTNYVLLPLDDKARAALAKGKNTLAVHCKQTGGGQYIDVGLVDVVPAE
jgi:hypothetical protein